MKYASIIVLVLVGIGVGVWFMGDSEETMTVTNFEECADAGNPVMESFPRQCQYNNKTFFEDITPEQRENIVTSADNAPAGSIHNLPVPKAVAAVRTLVARELGISEGVVIVMTAYEKDWPDACLGLTKTDEMCAQVITTGYEVTVQAKGSLFTYRTNADGTVLRKK